MLWERPIIHVIDFEGSPRTGVVEYGVASVTGQTIVATQTRLCRPKAAIAAEERAIHGLSEAETCQAAPFAEEWDLFSGLRRTGLLAAHHASFEVNLLKSYWPYPPFSPDFLDAQRVMADWGPWLDSHLLAKRLQPRLPSHQLEGLIDHFQLERPLRELAERHCPPHRRHFHCALFDALAAGVLLLELAARSDSHAPPSLAQWLNLSSSTSDEHLQTEIF